MIKGKFIWTAHSRMKMRYYRLSEQLVKRVIKYPARVEKGVIDNGVAVMRPTQSKKYSEIWVMYILSNKGQIKIITAWRYPAKSPDKDPVPAEILNEARAIIL